jgi:ketosteroid isomerase-like protein
MSQENVEIVRRGWEAWIRRDLDGLLALFDPAVEWDTTNFEGWPEDSVYHGQAGVRRFMEDWLASWDRYEAGVEEYLDGGGDRVVVLCWQQGFGPGSDVPVHMDFAQICRLKDGLVYRIEAWSDREKALNAVGRAAPGSA